MITRTPSCFARARSIPTSRQMALRPPRTSTPSILTFFPGQELRKKLPSAGWDPATGGGGGRRGCEGGVAIRSQRSKLGAGERTKGV